MARGPGQPAAQHPRRRDGARQVVAAHSGFSPTCSYREGYPRSTGPGARQTPLWHRSSRGWTARQGTAAVRAAARTRGTASPCRPPPHRAGRALTVAPRHVAQATCPARHGKELKAANPEGGTAKIWGDRQPRGRLQPDFSAGKAPPRGLGLCPRLLRPRPHPTHLEEARDVPLVAHAHGHHVLEEPEEGPVVALLGPGFMEEAVKLEEEPPGALCAGDKQRKRRHGTAPAPGTKASGHSRRGTYRTGPSGQG